MPARQAASLRHRQCYVSNYLVVDARLEALDMLDMLQCDEETKKGDDGGKEKTVWRYSLAAEFDVATLHAMVGGRPEEF